MTHLRDQFYDKYTKPESIEGLRSMYHCDLNLELSENVEADITVFFTVSSHGYLGDYFTEPDGPEFDIEQVRVNDLYGRNWQKSLRELQDDGWYDMAQKMAEQSLIFYDELYEHQYDAYL